MKHLIYILLLFFTVISCNENGNHEKKPAINKDLKIKACKIYTADFVLLDPEDKGLLLQEFRFNKHGYVNELIRYDIDGNITGRFDIFGEHTPFPITEKPEYIDTVLTVLEIDNIGNVKQKEIKTYNNEGLLIELAFYNESENLIKRNTYEYNNIGMIIKDVYWDIDLMEPKQVIRYEYEYFTD